MAVNEAHMFLEGTPRLSTLQLSAVDFFWCLVPMETLTTLTLDSDIVPIPLRRVFEITNLLHLEVTRKKGISYHPIEFFPGFENEDGEDESDATTRLTSLRIPICDLPSFYQLPASLRCALKSVKPLYLCGLEPFRMEDWSEYRQEPEEFEDYDEWTEWPSLLQRYLNEGDLCTFPSLEHLHFKLDKTQPPGPPTLKNYPSLCRITQNISILTTLSGCLEREAASSHAGTMWPRLGKVHFQDVTTSEDRCKDLVAWMAERGRRSDGAFTVALTREAMAKLEEETSLQTRGLKEMKEAVCLETTKVMYYNSWPPKDDSL